MVHIGKHVFKQFFLGWDIGIQVSFGMATDQAMLVEYAASSLEAPVFDVRSVLRKDPADKAGFHVAGFW